MILETLKNYQLTLRQETRYKIIFLEISRPALPGIWRLKKSVVYSKEFRKFRVTDETGIPCPINVASEVILLHYLKWGKLPFNTFLDIAIEVKEVADQMRVEPALTHINQWKNS
ncbi:hypothetical protein [Cesiribacter sp. SM1]|uniref:hypothetical protein n=1 Tax=Cesiribacter sp. SM1 TaxID=2861196 RepID=UPI001CD2E5F6|nr:hypothetical protein [Cesiribacter sp. SM1]